MATEIPTQGTHRQKQIHNHAYIHTHTQVNNAVNICPCNDNYLNAEITLHVTVSERVQGRPLWQQPVIR